jgi:alginate O-acetyltransferase complex protein AlgI
VTLFFFLCSLVVFRTLSVADGVLMFTRMFQPHAGLAAPLAPTVFWSLLLLAILAHVLGAWGNWRKLYERMPASVRGFGYATAVSLTLLLMPMAGKTFIYFQF